MKTLKQFVFGKMDKNGYCLDVDIGDFEKETGKRFSLCTAEDYKDEWNRLKYAKERFDDKEDKEINHIGRTYVLRYKGMEEHSWYKIPKIYFQELKANGVKIV